MSLLYTQLTAEASFGMIEAKGTGDIALTGSASMEYCTNCTTQMEAKNFKPTSNTSNFYFHRSFCYNLNASLGISLGVPGADIDTGLSLNISDTDVFDNIAPTITLPSSSAILDSLKFTPQSALSMLLLFDGE